MLVMAVSKTRVWALLIFFSSFAESIFSAKEVENHESEDIFGAEQPQSENFTSYNKILLYMIIIQIFTY